MSARLGVVAVSYGEDLHRHGKCHLGTTIRGAIIREGLLSCWLPEAVRVLPPYEGAGYLTRWWAVLPMGAGKLALGQTMA